MGGDFNASRKFAVTRVLSAGTDSGLSFRAVAGPVNVPFQREGIMQTDGYGLYLALVNLITKHGPASSAQLITGLKPLGLTKII